MLNVMVEEGTKESLQDCSSKFLRMFHPLAFSSRRTTILCVCMRVCLKQDFDADGSVMTQGEEIGWFALLM